MPASKLNADLSHSLSKEASDRVLTAPLQKPRQVDDLALVIRAQREQILALHREREHQTVELTRQIQELNGDGLDSESIRDLDDAVESLANPLRQLLPDRVQLVLKLNAKQVAVTAHLGQLAQMLTPLVLNARDAIGSHGVITLSTHPGPGDVLTVCDTGRGMDVDTVQRAFDPYFTTKTASLGLGLTALQQLANRLCGEISVDSAPGWGTSVGIALPVSEGGA